MAEPLVLVTGGAGFVGSALVHRLCRSGAKVRVLDSGYRGGWRRLRGLGRRVERIAADMRDARAVRGALRGVHTVFHLAYVNGTQRFYEIPHEILEVAVKGITNILDGMRAHRVRKLMLISSSEVYQEPEILPTPEAVRLVVPDLDNPRYSYGGGKIISELMATHCARHYGFDWRILRPHNIYGPDMGFDHVVPALIRRMSELRRVSGARVLDVPIEGNGEQTRSFCYIDDAVDGILLASGALAPNGVYHLGTDREVRIAELARRIARCLGLRIRLRPGPPKEGAALRRCPDISKLRNLGYVPKVSLDKGLELTCRAYLRSASG